MSYWVLMSWFGLSKDPPTLLGFLLEPPVREELGGIDPTLYWSLGFFKDEFLDAEFVVEMGSLF